MPFKSIFKYFLITAVFVFMLSLILISHVLPPVLDKIITENVISSTGLKDFHIHVRSMGLSGTDIGKIKIGKTADIDSVYVDYNFGALLKKRINQINISGLVIRAKLKDSYIEFPDPDITRLIFNRKTDSKNLRDSTNSHGIRDLHDKNLHVISSSYGKNNTDADAAAAASANTSAVAAAAVVATDVSATNAASATDISATDISDADADVADTDVSDAADANANDAADADDTAAASIAAFLRKISITNSSLVLKISPYTFIVPFNLSAEINRKEKIINLNAEIFPFGEKIKIAIVLNFTGDIKRLDIKADSFSLGQADKLISMYAPGVNLTGNTSIHIFKSMNKDENSDAPLKKNTASPKKNAESSWKINISRIVVKSPFKAKIDHFISSVNLKDHFFSTSGSFSISDFSSVSSFASTDTDTLENTTADAVKIVSPLKFIYSGDYRIKNDKQNPWNFSLKAMNSASEELLLESMQGCAIHIKKPVFNLNFKGKSLKGRGIVTGKCLKGEGNYEDIRTSFSKLNIFGKCNFDFNEAGKGLDFRFNTGLDSIKIIRDNFYSDFSGFKISGDLHMDSDLTSFLKLEPSVLNAVVKDDNAGIRINDISFNLPLVFPFDDKDLYGAQNRPGVFSLKGIIFKGQDFGKMSGKIFQTSQGCLIKGDAFITGLFKPGYKPFPIEFTADTGILQKDKGVSVNLKFNSKNFQLASDMINQDYLKSDSDIVFHCSTSLTGFAKFTNNRLKTGLKLDINDGSLSFKGENFRADNIKTSLGFDDLVNLRSLPAQVLTIDKISSNDIKISNAVVKYSIESIHSVLIENLSFNWCDGRVTTGSMRFSPDKNNYDIVFYCDRLKLARILNELGAFNADGKGSLNGRIPVHYENGNLSFDNGFLFSTPGLGGKIKVTGTEAFTAGIPMNSPEFAQIDLAREALKNYKYKWAKLIFNTSHDDLLVKMKFDGEPAKILPFEFKKELGRFIRVDVKSPGSHFQGIKIDINLKLPLNKFMKFTDRFKKLL